MDSRKTSPSEDSPRNAKQKSAKALQKLEVQAKQAATRTELASSEGGSSQEVRKRASKRAPRVRPFASETEMYEALTRKVLDAFDFRKFLEFQGIVYHFVHVLTIDHQVRVTAITDDLVNFAHLLFDRYVFFSSPLSLNGINSNGICRCRECGPEPEFGDSWYSMTYPCRCQSLVGEDCNGKVKVTAETNEFHPGGIGRQKTTVHVYHSKS
jgi:hypothetical protein